MSSVIAPVARTTSIAVSSPGSSSTAWVRWSKTIVGPAQRSPPVSASSPASSFSSTVLPAPLGPTTPIALAAHDRQVDAGEHRVELGVAQLDDALAAAQAAAQLQRHPAPLEHRPLDLVDAVDAPLHVARPRREPLVERLARPGLELTPMAASMRAISFCWVV